MIKVTIIGDIVCEKEMLKKSYINNQYIFDEMLSPLKNYFTDSNYVVCNLESVISNNLKYTHSTFSFCNPEELLISLKKIGINAISLANNHILDRKEEGIESTIEMLKKHNIEYFGLSNDLNIDIDDNKITILGYTDSTNYHINKYILKDNSKYKINKIKKVRNKRKGLSKYYYKLSASLRLDIKKLLHQKINPIIDNEIFNKKSIENIKNNVLNLKKNKRYVIIYPHVGGQFNVYPGSYTTGLINELNNFGCDSIIITHPHIIQDVKKFDNCFSIGDVLISPDSKFMILDSLPNYSVVLNYYFENNRLEHMTLSFLICKKDNDTYVKVYPFYDYYNSLSDIQKEKYYNEFKEVYKRIFDDECKVKKEYIIGKR